MLYIWHKTTSILQLLIVLQKPSKLCKRWVSVYSVDQLRPSCQDWHFSEEKLLHLENLPSLFAQQLSSPSQQQCFSLQQFCIRWALKINGAISAAAVQIKKRLSSLNSSGRSVKTLKGSQRVTTISDTKVANNNTNLLETIIQIKTINHKFNQ